jgi:hypothetical protein
MMNWRVVAALSTMLAGCGPDEGSMEHASGDENTTVSDALTSSSAASTWFPLRAGNTWSFKSNLGATRTISLSQVSQNQATVTGLYAQPAQFSVLSSTSPTLQRWAFGVWEPLIRFGYSNSAWTTSQVPCRGLTVSRSETGSVVNVPAGSFSDTRTIEFEWVANPLVRCVALEIGSMTFQAKVGLVRFETGRGEVFELVSATVNGAQYPDSALTDLEAKVDLDEASYVSLPNTNECRTMPCVSNARTAAASIQLEVKNKGRLARRFTLSSSCPWDVEILNAAGAVVRRLSDGRVCAAVASSVTLGPGQTRMYSARIPLAASNGTQLSGEYTARARWLPTGAPAVEGVSRVFRVTVLPP